MSRLVRSLVLVTVLVGLSAPTPMYAFNKPFSPTAHSYDVAELSYYVCAGINRSGKNDHNDVVRIRTTMSWNDTQAQNVRNYASNGQYYTHDITDMHNNLDGWCLWTNFPDAYYDWDDDEGETLKWEESEVAAINAIFPAANTNYSVNSYFARWTYGIPYSGGGFQWIYDPDGGQIEITPQMSERWMGEYNTVNYDTDPVTANYYHNPEGSSLAPVAESVESQPQKAPVTALSLGKNHEYTAQIARTSDRVFVEGMNVPVTDPREVDEYATWSRGLVSELRQAGVANAEVTVTLNRPVIPHDFEQLAADYQLDVYTLHVEYAGVNEHGTPEVWSGFIRNHDGIDFTLLDRAAQEQGAIDLTQPHGIVAVHGKVAIDQVERLNRDSRIFLADPIASYVELVASQNVDVQRALTEAYIERKARIRQQAEVAAQRGDRQAEAFLAAPDVDQAAANLLNRHPALQPRVTTDVHDFWHLIKP